MTVQGVLLDRTLLLRRRCTSSDTVSHDQIVELSDVTEILADCSAAGRPAQAARAEQRLRRGLKFCSYRVHGAVVANAWVALGSERFLDEAMLVFGLGPDMACLRDVFVSPQSRGRRIFARLVEAISAGPCHGISLLWSCVEADNQASVKAHRNAGFHVAGRVVALTVADRLMWRRADLPAELECRDFEPERHWIWLGHRAREYRRAHLA